MNEKQFKLICKECDQILMSSDSTIETVSIPWLHVIREHPIILERYIDLFNPATIYRANIQKMWRYLRNNAGWIRQIIRSFFFNVQPWFGFEKLEKEIDVIFISHLLNANQAGQNEDFYYSDLPQQLIKNRTSALVALINHSGQSAAHLVGKWENNIVPRLILSSSLRFSEEYAIHRRLKKEALRLKKMAKNKETRLGRAILERASEEALSNGSHTTIRMSLQISLLVAKLKPKIIIITHEGHSWERITFAAARKELPNVCCIAYQHAALFRLQHAIRRNLAPQYNPDRILTSGAISKAQLEHEPGLHGIPVSILGSNRTFKESGKKIRKFSHLEKQECLFKNACLVIPEGLDNECSLLFEFSLACAKFFPDIQFIWRLHPLVTFQYLMARNPKLRYLPGNIVLSQSTLEEDITRCRWALYRGTTAIVQAVIAGLRPIYLQLPGEMTIDPLYALNGWRVKVTKISDFQSIIESDSAVNDSFFRSKMQKAKRYCHKFFLPLDSRLITRIISKRA
jgi:hypothetical protein